MANEQAKFTLGNWKANGNGIHVGSRCVAIVPTYFASGVTEEVAANARLIAASPDYHNAAVEMIERHDEIARAANFQKCCCGDCRPFRTIVAKATNPQAEGEEGR